MDLQQLRTFVAIAEERNLTRASERLFVSQPAISAQLKSLEEELGVVLFHRVPKGMQLTPSGESLLQDARRTLAAASGLLHHAREMQAELVGRVRIGMNSDAEFLRIVDLQGALCRRHPRLELVFLPGSTVANVPQLRTEALDASFFCGNRDEPQLATWTLFQEDLAVAVPARLREAVGDGDIPTLARQPWIHTTVDCPYFQAMQSLFEAHGCRPARTVIADQEDAVASLVRSGIGLAILRREKIQQIGRDGTMAALPCRLPPVPLRFAVLARRANEPILHSVIEEVRRLWKLDLPGDPPTTQLPRTKPREGPGSPSTIPVPCASVCSGPSGVETRVSKLNR